MTYTTTRIVIEGLLPETQEWIDMYGPDAHLDLDEARNRWRQLKQLCPKDLKFRARRVDSVHVITTTTAILDEAIMNE